MQAQGHVQLMLRMELWGQDPQTAADAPRWRVLSGREVRFERGFPADVIETLRRMGHKVALESPTIRSPSAARRSSGGSTVATSRAPTRERTDARPAIEAGRRAWPASDSPTAARC